MNDECRIFIVHRSSFRLRSRPGAYMIEAAERPGAYMEPQPTLATQRLLLRPWQPDDAPELQRLGSQLVAHTAHGYVGAPRQSVFGMQVPLINRHAVDYLLRRGCRIDPSPAQFMSDEPFGSFERYLFTNPLFCI